MVTAMSSVTAADLLQAKLGVRQARLDLASRLAVLAVESLGLDFEVIPRERLGICLAARRGSLATDAEYWKGRDLVGGPSPTLFAYTLPSAAIGEIAIRYKLTGPCLCFVGEAEVMLTAAADLIHRGEVEGCLCVLCDVVTAEVAELTGSEPVASACALYLSKGTEGLCAWGDIGRDMEMLCAKHCRR